MRKIVQILYDQTMKSSTPRWLALCSDGTVWRQKLVDDPMQVPENGGAILLVVDPTYHTEWEQVKEFDLIPESDRLWRKEYDRDPYENMRGDDV